MNAQAPFLASDLEELDARLLSLADRVVPMRDISKGDIGRRVIGLRHDVDDNPGSFDTALKLAEWEFNHGYSSTYYLLHGSHYWNDDMLCRAPLLEEMGHEVGIHVNALSIALQTGTDPHMVLAAALTDLRTAVRVVGMVAHGDQPICGRAMFVNDEMFAESRRPSMGDPYRTLEWNGSRVQIEPVAREVYGIEYDANWLPRGNYVSDSGGRWSQSFDDLVGRFGEGQLHMLTHPDWWANAFSEVTV